VSGFVRSEVKDRRKQMRNQKSEPEIRIRNHNRPPVSQLVAPCPLCGVILLYNPRPSYLSSPSPLIVALTSLSFASLYVVALNRVLSTVPWCLSLIPCVCVCLLSQLNLGRVVRCRNRMRSGSSPPKRPGKILVLACSAHPLLISALPNRAASLALNQLPCRFSAVQ
jgi:hypothetical protein